jgi:hypothetical protein
MPLNEAELSRPKRVLVAVILLYAALSIGVARLVLDLYSAYPVTGPPWLTTMVNKTGIAWLPPIVVILSAFGNCCFIFSHNLPDRPGKELGQDLLFGALVNRHFPFPCGHIVAEIPGGSSDFRDVRPLAICIASCCPHLAFSE